MSGTPPPPRHRVGPHSRAALILRTGVVVGALVAGVLALVHWGLPRTGGDATTPADAAILPGHSTSAGASQSPGASSRATPASRNQRRTAPYHVVPGAVVAHKSKAQLAAEAAARIAARSFTFTIGTFNVLASQHSTPTGDHPSYPPASRRSVGAAALMKEHGVDVVGTQELKPDQLDEITRLTGLKAWPGYAFGSRNTDDSILYNPNRFEFVSGTSYPVKFMHAVRPQTVLRLRDRVTGREAWFVNTHVSAGFAPQYVASRRAGHYAAVAEVNKLKATGLPVFLTGDMNDRETFFCRVVPPTGLVAAVGGNVSGGCHPAPHLAVDWVLGTGGVSFTHYWEDRSPIGRISDHFFVSAVAHVSGATTP